MKYAAFDRYGVELFTSELWQTTSTLARLDGAAILFDPTYFPSEVDAIRKHCDGLPAELERRLVFTHSDWDHVVGFPRFHDWTTIAHTTVANKDEAGRAKILGEITSFDGKWYVERGARAIYPRIDQTISGETPASIGGDDAVFVPVPGHTDDMIATFFPARGVAIVGDLLSALEFPFVYHSVDVYRRTLATVRDRVRLYETELLVTGHGPPATSRTEIEERIDADEEYLARLVARVEALVRQGTRGEPLQHELQALTYRDTSLNPHILDFHRGNVTVAEREAVQRMGG